MRKIAVLFFAAVLIVFAGTVWAQTETGQISGTVTDATGGVVADAKVVVKSINTGMTRETTTNSSGLYTSPSLKPDTYDVTIRFTGFKTFTQRVVVSVGSKVEVSAQLTVGAQVEVVEVTGAPVNGVNTESQTLSSVITGQQLDELPTSPTRNPYSLVGTSGNVTEDTNSGRGAGFAINGMRSASTDILLDGAENVDTFTAGIGQTVPLDSMQEFSVLTNGFTAEFGRASGGVVNVVTKSGTNAFHGSAYEYSRLSALSSNTEQNDADGTPKSVFTRNNFGFAVGGPVKKNKLFFFSNTEWIRVRSASSQDLSVIDPASVALLAPASQAFFTAYGKLAPGDSIIATGPCATGSILTCDTVGFSVPSDAGGGAPQNTMMEVARVDYNFSTNTTLFVRYASYKELDFPGTVNYSPYQGYNTGQTNFDQNYAINLTHFFTPTLVTTAKAIYNRLNGPVQPLGTAPISPTLYTAGSLPSVTIAGSAFPLVFPGYNETTPGNSIPFGGPQNLYQFYDDISWTVGKHQFKFGGQFIQLRDNRIFGAYENPVENLGKNLTSGLTNLINGNIYLYQAAINPQGEYPCVKDPTTGALIQTPACTLTLPVSEPAFERNYHYNDGAFYAQDSWKIVPRFTLNAGIRWEYYGVQHNANPALDSNFVMGPGANIYDQIRNGAVELAQDGGVFWKPRYGNFGPRVGFAWDVLGNGKMAIRGGYAISYERNFGNVTFNAIQNPPNYAVVSLINASVNIVNGVPTGDVPFMPVYTDVAGPLAGSGTTKAFPSVSQRAINQDMKSSYAETWNLSLERQVGKGLLSAGYAGSHGIHLYDIANVNPTTGGGLYLGDANFGNRINYQYSNMNFRSDNGYSHYDALNVRYAVTNLLNKGLGLGANYTWSHSLDNLSSTFTETYGGASGLYQLGYLDAFNPQLNYGNSDFDIRHRLSLSGTWEIPWMKSSSNAVAKNVLGGWGLGAGISIRSGSPFTIYDCNNSNDTGCPLYIPSAPVARTGTATSIGSNLYNYIALPYDTVPHTDPDTGIITYTYPVANQGVSLGMPTCTGLHHTGCTYSTDGQPYPMRNQFFGPGFWNMDMNFYKNFKLTERFGLEFRGEFYNILNHHNQYISGYNLDVSSMSTSAIPFVQTEKGGPYGYAGTSADERRNIQFGLKLKF